MKLQWSTDADRDSTSLLLLNAGCFLLGKQHAQLHLCCFSQMTFPESAGGISLDEPAAAIDVFAVPFLGTGFVTTMAKQYGSGAKGGGVVVVGDSAGRCASFLFDGERDQLAGEWWSWQVSQTSSAIVACAVSGLDNGDGNGETPISVVCGTDLGEIACLDPGLLTPRWIVSLGASRGQPLAIACVSQQWTRRKGLPQTATRTPSAGAAVVAWSNGAISIADIVTGAALVSLDITPGIAARLPAATEPIFFTVVGAAVHRATSMALAEFGGEEEVIFGTCSGAVAVWQGVEEKDKNLTATTTVAGSCSVLCAPTDDGAAQAVFTSPANLVVASLTSVMSAPLSAGGIVVPTTPVCVAAVSHPIVAATYCGGVLLLLFDDALGNRVLRCYRDA